MTDDYHAVHAYGGREHDQPAPVDGCLLCLVQSLEEERGLAWAAADESRQLNHRLVEEIVDLKQGLRMLRDAWNAHFEACTHPVLVIEPPTLGEIAAWMNAPSDTASAHIDEDPHDRFTFRVCPDCGGARMDEGPGEPPAAWPGCSC